MKKLVLLFLITFTNFSYSQQNNYFEGGLFYGIIPEHDKTLNKSIQGQPYGFILGYSKRNTEETVFNAQYNYPDKGFSFVYQNLNSSILGESYGLYRHYTFHLKNRNNLKQWFVKMAFGLAYNTTPYNDLSNNENFAIGTNLLMSAFVNAGYINENLFNNIGLKAGISLIHYSNASIRNPNLGINTIALNLGLTYNLNEFPSYPERDLTKFPTKDFLGPIKYNLVVRGGLNQSLEVGSATYAFYHFTAYASKRLNYKNGVSAGIDYFISPFIKNYIPYYNAKYFTSYTANNTDRIGVFIGHEMHFNNFAFISQIGYHVHEPFQYESSIYERFGFKHKLSEHLFSEVSLKVNLFRAEGLEFGIGYQF